MIELNKDGLVFSFPEVHASARLVIDFQRTLRIPDDGKAHHPRPGPRPLPAAPRRRLRRERAPRVDRARRRDAAHVPVRGAVDPLPAGPRRRRVPLRGASRDRQDRRGHREDVDRRARIASPRITSSVPDQPWLDGYCVEKGVIRQFVAMPLGAGYTAEEQITGKAEHGGLQILVHPHEGRGVRAASQGAGGSCRGCRLPARRCVRRTERRHGARPRAGGCGSRSTRIPSRPRTGTSSTRAAASSTSRTRSCGSRSPARQPPTPPPTAAQYTRRAAVVRLLRGRPSAPRGLADRSRGSRASTTSGRQKGDVPLPENESVTNEVVVELRKGLRKDQVREGREM